MRDWLSPDWLSSGSFRDGWRGRGLAGAALVVLLWLPGMAAEAQVRGPCGQEMRKLCPDARPGTGEFRSCFEKHEDDLTPRCRERLAAGQERLDRMRKGCAEDIETHCADIPEGGGNLLRCLNEHADELSDACKQSVPRRARNRRPPAKAPEPQQAPEPNPPTQPAEPEAGSGE